MELARESEAVVRKPRVRKAQKKAVNRGRAKMNAAADKTLELNSETIAKSLLQSALNGNTTSAKLLFALAEGQIDCEDEVVMQKLCSLAEKLATEPEWSGDDAEAVAKSGIVECEPEGDDPARWNGNRDEQKL
jgi:hypothetical protein